MEIQLIAIGRTNIPFIKEGISEYSRRLARYITFRICELPDIKNSGRMPEERQKEEEGKLLLSNMTLSKMTFNHEMARMFFTEQLYRAMTIIKGEPYHHK